MPEFSKGQKRIASYILENYDKAAFMTAQKLGRLTEVSESTVVRFAAILGYDGYPGMQKALQEMIRSRLTSTQRLLSTEDEYSNRDLLTGVLLSESEKLRKLAEHADHEAFEKMVDRLLGAKHIYVLGSRSSAFVAGYLHFYLHLMLENVTIVRSLTLSDTYEQLFRIGEGDVLIAFSFPRYSNTTVNIARFALDRGASILAITDNQNSPLVPLADVALFAPCEMVSFVDSMVAPMSLVNALLTVIARRRKTEVADTFTELEKIWNTYAVFGRAEDED